MSPGFDPTRLEGRYLTLFNQGELGLQRLLSAAGTPSMGRAGAAFDETLVRFAELIDLITLKTSFSSQKFIPCSSKCEGFVPTAGTSKVPG